MSGEDGSGMDRRERRHPEDVDPAARAQDEARWSLFTVGIRRPISFRGRSPAPPRVALLVTVALAMIMVGLVYLAVALLSKLL